MTVYVDTMRAKFGRLIMCHMVADTDDELHAIASAIGVNRRHWQSPGRIAAGSHYDICLTMKQRALMLGAIEISLSTLAIMNLRRSLTGFWASLTKHWLGIGIPHQKTHLGTSL